MAYAWPSVSEEAHQRMLVLEAEIGFPRGSYVSLTGNPERRKALELWLQCAGLPYDGPHGVRRAQDVQLSRAFESPAYLAGWLRNAANGASRGYKRRWTPPTTSASAEAEAEFASLNTGDESASGADRDVASEATSASNGASEAEIRSLLETVIPRLVSAATQGLSADISALRVYATSTTLFEERVASALSNIELAELPSAKALEQQIATRAERAAKRAAERAIAESLPRRVEVATTSASGRTSVHDAGLQHERFPLLLRLMAARDKDGNGLNIWLSGPTGSGKTTAVREAAKCLQRRYLAAAQREDGSWAVSGDDKSLPFLAESSLDADYKVVGFRDANGNVALTAFRLAFEFGGVFCADEVDNWNASALVALNSATANGFMSFPDRMVYRHPDFVLVACANTWGLGATHEYVGRQKLDAATLDRFQPKVFWPYDNRLEEATAAAMAGKLGLDWCHRVQKIRKLAAEHQGLKIIISPRATFTGISLLQQGFGFEEVEAMVITAGISPEQAAAISAGHESTVNLVEAGRRPNATESDRAVNRLIASVSTSATANTFDDLVVDDAEAAND